MWRYLIGSGATLVLVLAGMFLFRGSAATEKPGTPPPPPQTAAATPAPLPDKAPSASERTREQKRFDRVDKDRDQSITKDEYFALRRKAFAKLDTDHDGKLSFDEWAIRNVAKFAGADKDKSGTLSRAEYATTAVKRKTPARPKCDCKAATREPAAAPAPAEGDGEE